MSYFGFNTADVLLLAVFTAHAEAHVLTDSQKQYTGHKAAGCHTQVVNSYTHFCRP